MSLGVVIKGPEGVVLAADSRITLEARPSAPEGGVPIIVGFDNATKLLAFTGENHKYVAAVTYGAALVADRTAHSFLPEFELELGDVRLPVRKYADRLSEFFLKRWTDAMPADYGGPPMTFIVGGYDEQVPYGSVFLFSIPDQPEPAPRNPGEKEFGMTWGGQLEVATRIIHGYDPALPVLLKQATNWDEARLKQFLESLKPHIEWKVPYQVLPLQDCIDLAIFLIRATIEAQSVSLGIRGVGGMIEVAVITRTEGRRYAQQKSIRGERTSR